jgi:hypothetical protein
MLRTSAKQAGLPRLVPGGVGAASAELHLFYIISLLQIAITNHERDAGRNNTKAPPFRVFRALRPFRVKISAWILKPPRSSNKVRGGLSLTLC